MTFDELLDYVRNGMKMQHVYQPVLIRALARAGGAASYRHLAVELASLDESSIAFYENRIKEMPMPVLRKNGVVEGDSQSMHLTVDGLTYEQVSLLVAACEERLASFIAKRGVDIWRGLLEFDPVPESIRYDVLKRDRTCRLCGAGPDDAQLQVDHIVPRSKGGSNDLMNLQVLCAVCNRGKSNRDDTDLRNLEG
jgi:hypothetical protein